jgi:flagellum-specific peptidoglycan hydrolase FlgJ
METRETRLNGVARMAERLEQQTGCLAQLLIAQWAIESKWGKKRVGHANYFGIKRAARHTLSCMVATHEVINGKSVVENLEFADYDSLDDSCRDYAWLITKASPYLAAREQFQNDRRLPELITADARVYATDPGYGQLPRAITGQANLEQAIARATEDNGKCPAQNRIVDIA